ncbi:unnamed protein product [Caenorhabditis brenneri]
MLMSICSKRLSYLIKLGRHRIDDANVHLKTGDLKIEVNRASKDLCNFCFNSTENGGVVPKGCDSLAEWFQNGNSDVLNLTATNSFEDVITVSNRLRSDFRVKKFCWKLFLDKLKDHNLKELISSLDFETCFKVFMIGDKIDAETLSFLIDRMNFKTRLKISSEIPSDFKHPRALDFISVDYEDASWLTVNDLKTIRNGSHVYLRGKTTFDNNDINEIIKYWTEREEMLFTKLHIKLRDGVEIDELAIINGVITIFDLDHKRHYFLSKKLIQTHSVGSFEFENGIITLTSWIFKSIAADTVTSLQLLDLRSDLCKSYSELIRKERELRTRLEEGEDGLRQEINRIKAEKKDVEVKFYETVDKLEILKVVHFGDSLEPDV